MVEDGTPTIRAVDRCFRILSFLVTNGPTTLSDIAAETGIPKSTVHTHLVTLAEPGYVIKRGNRYRAAMHVLELGGRVRHQSEYVEVIRSEMMQLVQETGYNSLLVTEENDRGVVVEFLRHADAVHLDIWLGSQFSLHENAYGKMILATYGEEGANAYIDEHGLDSVTENTVTSRDELMDELVQIGESGYSTDNEEWMYGLRSVAAPVILESGPDGDIGTVGAIGLSAATSRLEENGFREEIIDTVCRISNRIELNLGYRRATD